MGEPSGGPWTVKEVVDRIERRVEALEKSAARQATVRLSVFLSLVSGPGAAILTWWLTRR